MRVGLVVLTYNNHTPDFSLSFQEVLKSLCSQNFSGKIDVLFVDNLSSSIFTDSLNKFCEENSKTNISFSYISEKIPHNMYSAWNLGFYVFRTCHLYDVLGVSSDNDWLTTPIALQGAIDEFQNKSVGVVSIRSESDITVMGEDGNVIFPRLLENGEGAYYLTIDELLNFHLGFFSSDFLEHYDYRYIDILPSFGTESLLNFFCLGADKVWAMTRTSILANGKSRFHSPKTKSKPQGFTGYLIDPIIGKNFEQLILPGKSVGLGFQCWQRFAKLKGLTAMGGYWMDYDPSFYDENGKHKNPESLKKYLKDNMFLPFPDYKGRIEKSVYNFKMS